MCNFTSKQICKPNLKFNFRVISLRDEKQEMPENFENELFKWALECKYRTCADIKFSVCTLTWEAGIALSV